MKQVEIYLEDLKEDSPARKQLEALLGDDANGDWPVSVVEMCECPNGGDETDDCADCAYCADYHYEDGECVRRK